MALPRWISSQGLLDSIPESEYYEFALDAYDESGGDLRYFLVSGQLPLGLQITPQGRLQGVPVSEPRTESSIEYKFTVRVQNAQTQGLSDRTFSLFVSNNIAPAIEYPEKNSDIGLYLDGTLIDLQLVAVDSTANADLIWSLVSGELPPGVDLTPQGRLMGTILPIPDAQFGSDPGWDITSWSRFQWDFYQRTISKIFKFTLRVTDGLNTDQTTYTLKVYPRSQLTVDNGVLTADIAALGTGTALTVDYGPRHNPIITTAQHDLPAIQQGSFVSFQITAQDLDGDVINYSIPQLANSSFDADPTVGDIPRIPVVPLDGKLYSGFYPRINIEIDEQNIDGNVVRYTRATVDNTRTQWAIGDQVKILSALDLQSTLTWQSATVNNSVTITLLGALASDYYDGASYDSRHFDVSGFPLSVGDQITQEISRANVTVTAINAIASTSIEGIYSVTVDAIYNTDQTFRINSDALIVNGTTSELRLNSVLAIGISVAEYDFVPAGVGFDADNNKFDQDQLTLPQGLALDPESGWITGNTPVTGALEKEYQFELIAYKRDDNTYRSSRFYKLTVLGDQTNQITWLTDDNLGTMENGQISDFAVSARHISKTITYRPNLTSGYSLPQGLSLTPSGLIIGRVSFEMFGLDSDVVTLDQGRTTLDTVYKFSVIAESIDGTISSERIFTIQVVKRNTRPYEDLWLRAYPRVSERDEFRALIQNETLFPTESIYRIEDPNYGLAKNIRMLFLAGLNPSELSHYAAVASQNHFKKRMIFGDIKTAVARDNAFNIRYEVVYLEILDENSNQLGQSPDAHLDLSHIIQNPYLSDQSAYTQAYPNGFANMTDRVSNGIGYANKGALPAWMTSQQPNGRVLGFTRAVVLAYTKPHASELMANRLMQRAINFNDFEFVVDRYVLDNSYSENYNPVKHKWVTSKETTFDRFPSVSSVLTDQGVVDYAIDIPYDLIHNRSVDFIKNQLGGLDGIKNFDSGQTLIFFQQEFPYENTLISDYNNGWSDIQVLWGASGWDRDTDLTDNPYVNVRTWTANTSYQPGQTVIYNAVPYTVVTAFTSGSAFAIDQILLGSFDSTKFDRLTLESENPKPNLIPAPVYQGPAVVTTEVGWDQASYVPGFIEHSLNSTTPNRRAGIWRININTDNIVTLEFVRTMNFNDRLYVRNGNTHGSTNVYYDPVVRDNNTVPGYTTLTQQLNIRTTTFDGAGTRFLSQRDKYTLPEENNKYIKFGKLGVFN